MKNTVWLGLGLCALLLCSVAGAADNALDRQTRERLDSMHSALDELNSTAYDIRPEERSTRGDRINSAFVALTGEAVNPLFGVTALGIYNYFRTPDALRDGLPLYDQPIIWGPLLAIILLMLFNSTICEAMPFLKVPLNAIGDIVNKAGAVAVLPLVIKMFADAVAQPAAEQMMAMANYVFPVAYAGEAGAMQSVWFGLGWFAGAVVGFITYAAVWLTFNVVDVLILICPFPGIDALLKSIRLSIIGILAGSYQVSPTLALVIAVFVTLVSLLLAGWSFRLSVFGLIYSSDILFFRKSEVSDPDLGAFSGIGLTASRNIPIRTWGRLHENDNGVLVFSYRPWLVMPRRDVSVGPVESFSCGRGLLNPFLVANDDPDKPWLRLPPRYRGREDEIASLFGLKQVVDCGVSGALRSWLSEYFGSAKAGISAR